MKCSRLWFVLSAIAGVLGVLMGSIKAHGLASFVPEESLQAAIVSMSSAVEYNMFHALALFGVALWFRLGNPGKLAGIAGVCFALGILLFSGLIYFNTLNQARFLHNMVPVGGMFYLIGWIFIGLAGLRGGNEAKAS